MHPQDTLSMNSARPHFERNPKWVKRQEDKIAKGIEDSETKYWQTCQLFDEMLELTDQKGIEMELKIEEDVWFDL